MGYKLYYKPLECGNCFAEIQFQKIILISKTLIIILSVRSLTTKAYEELL